MKNSKDFNLKNQREVAKEQFLSKFLPLFEKYKELEKISWTQMYVKDSSDGNFEFLFSPDDCLINDKNFAGFYSGKFYKNGKQKINKGCKSLIKIHGSIVDFLYKNFYEEQDLLEFMFGVGVIVNVYKYKIELEKLGQTHYSY